MITILNPEWMPVWAPTVAESLLNLGGIVQGYRKSDKSQTYPTMKDLPIIVLYGRPSGYSLWLVARTLGQSSDRTFFCPEDTFDELDRQGLIIPRSRDSDTSVPRFIRMTEHPSRIVGWLLLAYDNGSVTPAELRDHCVFSEGFSYPYGPFIGAVGYWDVKTWLTQINQDVKRYRGMPI